MSDPEKGNLVTNLDEILAEARTLGIPLADQDSGAESRGFCSSIRADIGRITPYWGHGNSDLILTPTSTPSHFDEWNPGHSLVEITELKESVFSGRTKLSINHRWSDDMVHSTDLMMPISILLRKLMDDGDDISDVDSFRLSKLIKRDMIIYAKRGAEPDDALIENEDEPSFTMKLCTKNGHEIFVTGYQEGDEELPIHYSQNLLLTELLTGGIELWKSMDGREFRFFTSSYALFQGAEPLEPEMPLAERLTIPMDLMMNFSRLILKDIDRRIPVNDSYVLAAEFTNFKVPEIRDLLQGVCLSFTLPTFDDQRIKTTKSKYTIIPIVFKFEDVEGVAIGSGIFNVALPKTEKVGREYYEQG